MDTDLYHVEIHFQRFTEWLWRVCIGLWLWDSEWWRIKRDFLVEHAVLCISFFSSLSTFFLQDCVCCQLFFPRYSPLKRTLKHHLQHEESYQIPIHCSLKTSKTIFLYHEKRDWKDWNTKIPLSCLQPQHLKMTCKVWYELIWLPIQLFVYILSGMSTICLHF